MTDTQILELFKKMKRELVGLDFEDQIKQASFRKLRHHLDMLIKHFS